MVPRNIITAVSSRLTGTGGRVSGLAWSACHSPVKPHARRGVFSQSWHGRIEQDNLGAIWFTSASLSACCLVLKGTTSNQRGKKRLRKKGTFQASRIRSPLRSDQRDRSRHRPLYLA